jgi:hypothetical protein
MLRSDAHHACGPSIPEHHQDDIVLPLDGRDFWERDGHWNLRGHEKMAQAVGDYLKSRGIARPSQSR